MVKISGFRPAVLAVAASMAILTGCNTTGTNQTIADTPQRPSKTTSTETATGKAKSRKSTLSALEQRRRLFAEGTAAMNGGQYKMAADRFRQLTRLFPTHAGYRAILGHSLLKMKDLDGAEIALGTGAALASQAGNTKIEAFAGKHLALVLMEKKDLAGAANIIDRTQDLYRHLDDMKNVAMMYGLQAIIARRGGNHAKALSKHKRALTLKRQLKDQRGVAIELQQIGLLQHFHVRQQGSAEPAMTEAISIFKTLGDEQRVASVRRILGLVYKRQRKLDQGIQTLKAALEYYRRSDKRGDQIRQAEIMGNLATIHHTKGELETSLAMQRRALNLEIRLGLKGTTGSNYFNIGNVLKDMGDMAGACENWRLAEIQYSIGRISPLAIRAKKIRQKHRCGRELET